MTQDQKIGLTRCQMIVETVFDATEPTTMGSKLIHMLISVMGVKGATLFVVNPRTETLEILATEGLSIDYVNKGPILVDKSIKLALNLDPVIIHDTEKSDRLQYPEKAVKEDIRSIVSLPINLKGKIIGALRIYHGETWQVSKRELACLSLIARFAGMFLRYFRLSSVVLSLKETVDEIHPIWLYCNWMIPGPIVLFNYSASSRA